MNEYPEQDEMHTSSHLLLTFKKISIYDFILTVFLMMPQKRLI